MLDTLAYAIPFFPLLTRGTLVARFSEVRSQQLREEEQDRNTYRIQLLAFIPVSAAGLAALAVAEEALRVGLHWALYYLSISFLSYVAALQSVSYLTRRWEDQLINAFIDIGTLSLFLGVVAILVATRTPTVLPIAGFAVFIWGADHCHRVWIDWSYHDKLSVLASTRESSDVQQ